MGVKCYNEAFGPHSVEGAGGTVVRDWLAWEHHEEAGVEAKAYIPTGAAFNLHTVARQPGQTQAGFDSAATQTFPPGWYASRSPSWRALLFRQCRDSGVYPPD